MGTRGIIAVIHEGQYKVTKYGQYDHYPEGQGLDILHWLKHPHRQNDSFVSRFAQRLENVVPATEKDIQDAVGEVTGDPYQNGFTVEQMNRYKALYPNFSIGTGAKILDVIWDAPLFDPLLIDMYEMSHVERWEIEGIYTLDLDARLFISDWHGDVMAWSLDALPDYATYLAYWKESEEAETLYEAVSQ